MLEYSIVMLYAGWIKAPLTFDHWRIWCEGGFSLVDSHTLVCGGGGLSEQDKKTLNRLIKRVRSFCGYQFSYWKPGWPVCICSQRPSPLFCFVVLIKTIGRKKNCRKDIRPYVNESACADVVWKRFLFRVPITVLSRARGVPFLPRARQGAVYT